MFKGDTNFSCLKFVHSHSNLRLEKEGGGGFFSKAAFLRQNKSHNYGWKKDPEETARSKILIEHM